MKTARGNGMKYLMTVSVVQVIEKVEKETRQKKARFNGLQGTLKRTSHHDHSW